MKCTIDIGASHHMIDNLNLFTQTYTIISSPLSLPNRTMTFTIMEGIMEGHAILYCGFMLECVIFAHALQHNLISMSQLIGDANCVVRFTPNLCTIHDQHFGSLIVTTPTPCTKQVIT